MNATALLKEFDEAGLSEEDGMAVLHDNGVLADNSVAKLVKDIPAPDIIRSVKWMQMQRLGGAAPEAAPDPLEVLQGQVHLAVFEIEKQLAALRKLVKGVK